MHERKKKDGGGGGDERIPSKSVRKTNRTAVGFLVNLHNAAHKDLSLNGIVFEGNLAHFRQFVRHYVI